MGNFSKYLKGYGIPGTSFQGLTNAVCLTLEIAYGDIMRIYHLIYWKLLVNDDVHVVYCTKFITVDTLLRLDLFEVSDQAIPKPACSAT